MIYITTAMFCEAKPIIEYFNLKKDTEISFFQVFKNNECTLIVSGIGETAAAIATTHLLTKFQARETDIFLNIGICGSKNKSLKLGTPVLCHKIIQNNTQKTFFPDILFNHPFQEGVLETFSHVVNKEIFDRVSGDIVDMEGASAFQAAQFFLPPHQIHLIKIISDFLEIEGLTKDKISNLININLPVIKKFLDERIKYNPQPVSLLTPEEELVLEKITENLRLTKAMEHQLKSLVKQYKIRKGTFDVVLHPYLEVICQTKREGKMYFAELKKRLLDA